MEKLLKTKKDREEFLLWLDFLYAGVFPKARLSLQGNKDSYCCLGVGCILMIPEKKLLKEDNILSGTMPRYQESSPLWFKELPSYTHINFKYRIAGANDNGVSHREIAIKLMELFKDQL